MDLAEVRRPPPHEIGRSGVEFPSTIVMVVSRGRTKDVRGRVDQEPYG